MAGTMRLLGLEFADQTVEAAAEWLAQRAATEPFGYVTTPNADHLVRLSRHPDLLPLYQDAMLQLLDSRVVALMARLVGLAAPRVAPGSDLTALLLTRYLAAGERITIIGLAPDWLRLLVARCGIAVPAHYDPPHGFEREAAAMRTAVDFVSGASGAVRVPGGRLAAPGVAGCRHPRDGTCVRHWIVHRCQPGVHRRSTPSCPALDAACGAGMVAPARQRSTAFGATLSDRQPANRRTAMARADAARQ